MTMPTPAAESSEGVESATDKTTETGTEEQPRTAEEQLAELAAKVEALTANSRKWEARAKENKSAAEKLAELEAANATPDQKLTLAEKRAAEAERELARYKVAAETGLPADLLVGDDEDAMRAYAERLAEFTKAAKPKAAAPKADPSQGPKGSDNRVSQAELGKAAARARFGDKN